MGNLERGSISCEGVSIKDKHAMGSAAVLTKGENTGGQRCWEERHHRYRENSQEKDRE